MSKVEQTGFTLVEVIMFLAISGLFVIIAFMGVSQRSGQVQFTDSMRSLQSFIQRQQNEVYNGVNLRGSGINCRYDVNMVNIESTSSSTGASDYCVTVGKLIHFNDDGTEIEVYPIVGRFLRQTVDKTSAFYLKTDQSDIDLIEDYLHAWVLLDPDSRYTYSIKWGTEFKGVADGSHPLWLGFIRSPISSAIFPFSTNEDNIDSNGDRKVPLFFNNGSENSPVIDGALLNVSANYCFVGANDQVAEINIGTSTSKAIELKFDSDCNL